MDRLLPFAGEHEMFRRSFGQFLDKEIAPYYEQWEKDGIVPREVFKKFGDQGYLCIWLDEEYGGAGGDFLYNVIQTEEINARGLQNVFIRLHGDVVAPYIAAHGTGEQKKKWLPDIAAGTKILAIAMTEPNAGSDLANLQTKAVKQGDHYVINGSKTFISNGMLADLVLVAVRTDPTAKPYKGISLLLVDTTAAGFSRTKLRKIGMHAQDTAELSFVDCKVPVANLIGEENKGFYYMMEKLQQERLIAAYNGVSMARRSLDLTLRYVKERQLFGKTLGEFQNTQFVLAKAATEIEMGQSFADQLTLRHMAGEKVNKEVSMAKYFCCDMAFRVSTDCLQMFGGYGVCEEYPIAKQFTDTRFLTITAGTSEVQLLIIAKELGL